MDREIWAWRDSRTGARVSISSTMTKEQAERELEDWRRRDARGGRPDLHESMPFIEVYRVFPEEDWPHECPVAGKEVRLEGKAKYCRSCGVSRPQDWTQG